MVMISTEEEKPKVGKGKNSPGREAKPKSNGQANGVKTSNPHEVLVGAIKEFLDEGSPASELKSFLEPLGGTPQLIMDALFEALFKGVGKGLSKEVVKKKKFLKAAVEEDGSQLILLNAIESFCGKANPEAVKEVAVALKALYDNDVLEEEFIVEWYEKGLNGGNKSSPIWKNVKPFVDWLQSAESETEDE